MSYQCENCGQTALETDTICWHCGQPLSPPNKKQETPSADEDAEKERPLPLVSLAAYGGLTLVIIIALFMVMQALGRQPQVVQGFGASLKPGWTAVTDQQRTFTLNLPTQWKRLDRFDPEQEAEFIEQIRRNNQYQAALAPYDAMADDRQLLLLAVAEMGEGETAVTAPPPFVIIARSRQLSQQSPEQMMVDLRQGPAGTTLLRSNLTEGVNGRQQTISILTWLYGGQELRCQHLFFKDAPDSYIVVGCAPEASYGSLTNIFHEILVSFQPLLP